MKFSDFYPFQSFLWMRLTKTTEKLTRGESAHAFAEIQTAFTLVQYQLFIELPTEQAGTAANFVGRVGEANSPE